MFVFLVYKSVKADNDFKAPGQAYQNYYFNEMKNNITVKSFINFLFFSVNSFIIYRNLYILYYCHYNHLLWNWIEFRKKMLIIANYRITQLLYMSRINKNIRDIACNRIIFTIGLVIERRWTGRWNLLFRFKHGSSVVFCWSVLLMRQRKWCPKFDNISFSIWRWNQYAVCRAVTKITTYTITLAR